MPARPLRFDAPVLHAIEACHVCAEACILCADTSLDEAAASLARCIRLALDCAEPAPRQAQRWPAVQSQMQLC